MFVSDHFDLLGMERQVSVFLKRTLGTIL